MTIRAYNAWGRDQWLNVSWHFKVPVCIKPASLKQPCAECVCLPDELFRLTQGALETAFLASLSLCEFTPEKRTGSLRYASKAYLVTISLCPFTSMLASGFSGSFPGRSLKIRIFGSCMNWPSHTEFRLIYIEAQGQIKTTALSSLDPNYI